MDSAQNELLKASTELQGLLRAQMHSISLAVPREDPTHLRIILSTDPLARRILGLEFSTDKGIAGWACRKQQPFLQNPGDQNPEHFEVIDMFAGTSTGKGAILTFPLVLDGRCLGVIQFIKSEGGRFEETDLLLASPHLPDLAQLLVAVDDTKDADSAARIS